MKKVRKYLYEYYIIINIDDKEFKEYIDNKKEEIKEIDKDKNKFINKNVEYEKEKEDETDEKIQTIFIKIKNFEQLKREVYEIKKNNDKTLNDINEKMDLIFHKYNKNKNKGGAITFEQIEEEKNYKNYLNDKLSEIDNKFKFILGDIIINEEESDNENNDNNLKSKDMKITKNNKKEQSKKPKILNLLEINRRLTQLHLSKLSSADFDTKNELTTKKISQVESKINELITNLFGVNADKIDDYKVRKQLNFVSKKEFETYRNKSEEEFKKIWEEINNLKKLYDEIHNNSNNNPNIKDLETLKDLILQKTEELFVNQNKKYSTNFATLEVLQEQFKKLLELLAIKEEQEKENWLVAKKPIAGFSCASCESYIGDLKNDKNRFIHWNKLPLREREMSGEKFFRVGNGYSRLLQMINFDNNGNVTLNPFANNNNDNNNTNNNNNSVFSNSYENNKSRSLSRERNNSSNSRSKKGSKEKNKTIDIIKSKNDDSKNCKKLPVIKCSMSTDNFEKLSYNNKNNQNINNSGGGNNTSSLNFKNTKITKVLKKNNLNKI